MRPAFTSTTQKAGFCALLLFLLAGPVVIGKKLLPPREQLYSSASWGLGAFPYLHDQVFTETNDIDIAFMGSSPIWWGIDTPHVQAELSRQLGRPAVVRSLCWNWSGFDPFYFIAKDLLAHRRVHMIVFCDLSPGSSDTAQVQAARWFRLADNGEELTGLGGRAKASFYASAIQGMPRNLADWLRSDLPAIDSEDISWGDFKQVANPAHRLGSLPLRMSSYHPFAEQAVTNVTAALSVRVCPPDSPSAFEFSHAPLPPMQVAFAGKIAALAAKENVRLVYLHMPKIPELGSAVIPENADWPALFQNRLTMVGIPAATLYAGQSRDEVTQLYWDFQHLNQNGQVYFTRVITPRLLQLYEAQSKP